MTRRGKHPPPPACERCKRETEAMRRALSRARAVSMRRPDEANTLPLQNVNAANERAKLCGQRRLVSAQCEGDDQKGQTPSPSSMRTLQTRDRSDAASVVSGARCVNATTGRGKHPPPPECERCKRASEAMRAAASR